MFFRRIVARVFFCLARLCLTVAFMCLTVAFMCDERVKSLLEAVAKSREVFAEQSVDDSDRTTRRHEMSALKREAERLSYKLACVRRQCGRCSS